MARKAGAGSSDDAHLVHEGRRVLLKWHKLRRAVHEPPFSLKNLRKGLALGASLEIDARLLADGAWVCLHDDLLDEETDGKGPVSGIDSNAVGKLRIAGARYAPPLLQDVVREIKKTKRSAACVQIDLKEAATTLTDDGVEKFAELIAPVAKHCLLSGTDWPAVERLGAAVPGLRLGYDPYDIADGRSFPDADAIRLFIEVVFAIAPSAAAFYLYHHFVAQAFDLGVDPIAPLRRNGAIVDVWTLDPETPDIIRILPRMIAAGADQITTNDPLALARLWKALPEGSG